jgi:S1-C subfamily serine protease
MSDGPVPTAVCPRCGGPSPVRLEAGQVCATCASRDAWSDFAPGKARLVLDEREIRRVEERLRPGRGWRRHGTRAVCAAIVTGSIAASAGAALALVRYFEPQPIGPLPTILERLAGDASRAALLGLLAAVLGIAGLVWLRRSRDFRFLPLLVPALLAGVAGLGVALTGGLIWLGTPSAPPWRFGLVPPVDRHGSADPLVHAIQRATVAILAPDAEGDARAPALGSGAVVWSQPGRAWIVTCSHVAMPYEAVGAWRTPRDARPVWVTFSDGRGTPGTVRWTWPPPLDLVLVETPIENPPPPVTVSPDTQALLPGTQVLFVPNPLRNGWMVHRGEVLQRALRRSPAGEFRLVRTDLPAVPGDSGSGLFDAAGHIVGINTWVRVTPERFEAVALPAEAMRVMVEAIQAGRLEQLDAIFPGGVLR